MASEGTGPMELGGRFWSAGVEGGSPQWSPGLPLRTAGSDALCAHLRDTFRTLSMGVGWKRPGTEVAGGFLSSAREWRKAVNTEV